MVRWKYLAESVVRMVPTWCPDTTSHPLGAPLSGDVAVFALHTPSDSQVALYEHAQNLLLRDIKAHSRERDDEGVDGTGEEGITDPLLGVPVVEEGYSAVEKRPSTLEIEVFTRELAISWLKGFDKTVEWEGLVDYLDSLRYRTYENEAVTLTLVVDPRNDVAGNQKLTDDVHQKLLDMAAVSPETFIRVDRHLRFVGYEEAKPGALDGSFRCAPHFATLAWRSAGPDSFVIHRTRRGDVLISRPGIGLVASWRKGGWYVYERSALERVFGDIFGTGGWAVLDLVFDLSYRRHGALLVYDPGEPKKLQPELVSNRSCFIRPRGPAADTTHALLGLGLHGIRIDSTDYKVQKRRLFAEIASMDGAVIFDEEGIRAFGAMIVTRDDIDNVGGGARTTAMYSARRYGAFPVKVSADGDVTLFYPGTADIIIRFA